MAAPKLATIANEVGDQLSTWLKTASSYMDGSTLEFKMLERSIDKLARVDALNASVHRAVLFHCIGDLDAALYWINNAVQLGGNANLGRLRALLLSNLGYFSRAVWELKQLTPDVQVPAATIMFLTGAYELLVSLGQENADIDTHILQQATRCSMTLTALHISEQQFGQVIDLMGEVLRDHQLFFDGEISTVHAVDGVLLYQLEVSVDPAAAARMTDEVVVKMVERDLDLPGLAVSFIGTKH